MFRPLRSSALIVLFDSKKYSMILASPLLICSRIKMISFWNTDQFTVTLHLSLRYGSSYFSVEFAALKCSQGIGFPGDCTQTRGRDASSSPHFSLASRERALLNRGIVFLGSVPFLVVGTVSVLVFESKRYDTNRIGTKCGV